MVILLTLVLSASGFALPALGAPKGADNGKGMGKSSEARAESEASSAPSEQPTTPDTDDRSAPPGDGTQQPSASPQPSGSTSVPSEEPTGSGSESGDGVPRTVGAQGAELSMSLTTSPSSILVGQTSHVIAEVTNTGDATASDLIVDVSVPSQLDIMDAGPEPFEPRDGGATVRFHLGSLPAGDSDEAWLDLEGAHPTTSSGATVSASAAAGDLLDSGSAQIVVVGSAGNEDLSLTTSTDRLLVQIGDFAHYSITVTNVGETTLHDVVIVDRLPSEIRYWSVDFAPEIDAVQVGQSGDKEDIVWVKNSLRPGRSVTVTWTGRASSLGDFAAVNSVTVEAEEADPVNQERTTYLGIAAVSSTSNPDFDPIVKARRIERTVTRPAGVGGTQGSVLPVTGLEDPRPVIVGLVLIALGGLVLWSKRWREPHKKWTAITLALVMTASTACVGNEPNDQTAQKSDADPSEDDKKDKKNDDVKGRRIERNNDNNDNDDGNGNGPNGTEPGGTEGNTTDPSSPSVPVTAPAIPVAAPLPSTGPAPTEQVTVTRRVLTTIGLGDLAIDQLGARQADNQMSFSWSEPARQILQATSSRSFTKGATVELLTSLGAGGDQIDVTVMVRNLSNNRRLAVDGDLIHQVSGSSGSIASFSAPVDTVLAPGGETTARFTYLLPSGDYNVTARFQPN